MRFAQAECIVLQSRRRPSPSRGEFMATVFYAVGCFFLGLVAGAVLCVCAMAARGVVRI